MTGAAEAASGSASVLLLGIGDTHGDFRPLFEAARREPVAQAILQVGDLTAGKPGRDLRPDDDPATLAALPIPLVWVHGNHEHWEMLGLGDRDHAARGGTACRAASQPPVAAKPAIPGHHLWAGVEYTVPGTAVRVVGLPGNFAPTWYDRAKPFPGDRVRHFNSAEVEAVARFIQPAVLLLHESFRGHSPSRVGAMGIPVLSQLVRRVRPEVCLSGHHHTYAVAEHGPLLALGLPLAARGYARLWFTADGQRRGWEFVPFDAE